MSKRRTTAILAATLTAPLIAVGVIGANMASASSPAAHITAAHTSVARTTVAASATHRSPVLVATGGVTMLKLNSGTAAVLTKNGVGVTPASEARPGASGITFPIRGGELNPANLHGILRHEGGLTFKAGGKSLTVRDFTVSTTSGHLTGYVDQARVRIDILNLSLAHAKVKAGRGSLAVSNVTATLNSQAAKALDSYFSTKLFTAGLTIGTVRVSAETSTLYR